MNLEKIENGWKSWTICTLVFTEILFVILNKFGTSYDFNNILKNVSGSQFTFIKI